MLTQLTTVKARLGLADTTQDELLTRFIQAVSARFDRECGRTFARTVGATHEFRADEREVIVGCYPIEQVTQLTMKEDELTGWVPQSVSYLVRQRCVVSLGLALGTPEAVGRVTYTGGYVLPGDPTPATVNPNMPPVRLPADLEHAATEQVVEWWTNRDKLGLVRHWPSSGTFLVFQGEPLLRSVVAVLGKYVRWGV